MAICAIAGMGGVGKTELAIQYARTHLQTYQGGVCWLQVRSLDIGVQIVKFGRSQLNLNLPEDPASQVAFCWRHWPEGEVLVVLDDVIDYNQVKAYLPPESSRFKVLITTREGLGPPLARLDLNVLQPETALNLLRSLVGAERIERELAVAEKLCEWLGYLPLGLELVGRYLEQDEDLLLGELQQRLNRKRLRHKALVEADPTMRYQLGVADAFELSWERLDENAQQLGCLLSLFALSPIPWSLLENVVPEQDSEDLESARRALVRLHLLQRTGEGTYRLHQLIREFLQEKLAQSAQVDQLKQAFAVAMVAEASKFPNLPTYKDVEAIKLAIPHMAEVAERMTDFLSDKELYLPFTGLSCFYKDQGSYDSARFWLEQGRSVIETRPDAEHPAKSSILSNLASCNQAFGCNQELRS